MKKISIFSLIISIAINFSASAQKKKVQFHSINTFGIVGGESEASTAFQTVNGIEFSNWYSGVGIGIDNYRYKTLPLFFDIRRYFGSEKKGFIYGYLGYNFPMKNKPGKEMIYYDNYHFKGGIYTELGLGFRTKFIKNTSLLFSLAQSYKQLQSRIGIVPTCAECDAYWYDYKFGYGRMILKAGLIF